MIATAAPAAEFMQEIPFEKNMIHSGAGETAAVTDVNGDGTLDIICGENWFAGPKWTRHQFRKLGYANSYIDAFSDLVLDVNGDGRPDVVTNTWFGRKISWYENPGKGEAMWKEHPIDSGAPSEFSFLVDLNNDGKAHDVLPQFGGKESELAWYEHKGAGFVKHQVHPQGFGHGIGAGDVNGDGRTDVLTPKGWWEAPADPDGEWTHHEDFVKFEFPHLGFMHVLDVNADGRNDVLTSFAHGYGILWLEQTGGEWNKHVIDESWSQPHAITLADLNGDGQVELVTGKRFHAHNGKDPGGREPLGVFWYDFVSEAGGKVTWKRHVMDYGTRTGGGMQIPVADIDGDGDLDIITPGKGGLFLFENLERR